MSNSSHPFSREEEPPPKTGEDALAPTYNFLTSAETMDASFDTYVDTPKEPVKKREYKRGDTIGRYVLLDTVGAGGMGTVWTAYDTKLDRRVALKLLHSIYASSAQARRRLEREARALAQLSHPNVVQVHDVEFTGDQLFVAMEYVEGMSLREWVRSNPRPSWRDVLRAYIDAARGLDAAHAKGLVHRDFKPANTLMGNDDRVRVVDFGLAIASRNRPATESSLDGTDTKDLRLSLGTEETLPSLDVDKRSQERKARISRAKASAERPKSLNERLTNSGLVIGTPVYMAPEQYMDGEVGPAADQYSLCTSLYEGLYGKEPFELSGGKAGVVHLMEAKLAGKVPPPPDDSPVPARFFRIIQRGLAPEPDQRYPSFEALIAALSHDPAKQRQARIRAAAFIGITVASILLAVWALTLGAQESREQCSGLDAELSGVWDSDVAKQARQQFEATGLSYAPTTFQRVAAFLDDYRASWVAMRTEACEATRIHHTQTAEVMTLRMTCLNRKRSRMKAVTRLFASKADPDLVTNAVQAVQALPVIEGCADIEALSAAIPLPRNPLVLGQIEAFQERVDEVEALTDSGKYSEALERGETLLDDMRSFEYAPLEAQAMYTVGFLRDEVGDYSGAEMLFRQTIQTAAKAKAPVLVAKASSLLQFTIGYSQRRYEVALGMEDWVRAAAELADDDVTRGESRNHLALVLRRMERFEAAKDLLEEAMAFLERALGPEHPSLAVHASNLASVLRRLGQYDDAKTMAQRALDIRQNTLGSDHPDVASSLNRLAGVLLKTGQYPQAQKLFTQALSIRQKAWGPDHRLVSTSLNDLGYTALKLGKYDEAKQLFKRAFAIYEKNLKSDDPRLATSLNNLAQALIATGRYDEAEALCKQALKICQKDVVAERSCTAGVLISLGRALVQKGQLDIAQRHLEQALDIREKIRGSKHRSLALPLLELAQLYAARDISAEAILLLERALKLPTADPEIKARIQYSLSQTLWNTDRDRAFALAEESLALYQRIGNQPMIDKASEWLERETQP